MTTMLIDGGECFLRAMLASLVQNETYGLNDGAQVQSDEFPKKLDTFLTVRFAGQGIGWLTPPGQ